MLHIVNQAEQKFHKLIIFAMLLFSYDADRMSPKDFIVFWVKSMWLLENKSDIIKISI